MTTEKNYHYRPLEYGQCKTCSQEIRRRGKGPWSHFGSAYGPGYDQLRRENKTTPHEPNEAGVTVSDGQVFAR